MTLVTRRSFSKKMVGSLAAYGLIETLFAHELFAAAVKPVVHKWLRGPKKTGTVPLSSRGQSPFF